MDSQDHASLALARLIQVYKNKPNITALFNAMNAHSQYVEDAFQQLYTERSLAVAVGDRLDQLGTIIGLGRLGADDDTYRLRLQAEVKVNRSSGLTEEILEIFGLICAVTTAPPGGTPLFQWVHEPPAGFTLVINTEVDDTLAAFLISILRRARAGGVGGRLQYNGAAYGNRFRFDVTGHGFDTGGSFSTKVL